MMNNASLANIKSKIICASIIIFVALAPVVYLLLNVSFKNFTFDLFTITTPIMYLIIVVGFVLKIFGIEGKEIFTEEFDKKYKRLDLSTKSTFLLLCAMSEFFGFFYIWIWYQFNTNSSILYKGIALFVFSIFSLLIIKNTALIQKIEILSKKIAQHKFL